MASRKKPVEDLTPSDAPQKLDAQFYGMTLDDEQLVLANAIWNPDIDIVFCNARAGTGKTTVAAGVANMLVLYGFYGGIVYIMSPYGERKQGYLPGSVTEKSSVYFEAFMQALTNCNVNITTAINDESMVNQKNGTGYITCITDTFLRGTNLDNAVVILDEAQNATTPQLKKILTRIGQRTKVIVIGHDEQCDLENPATSGFTRYMEHFRNKERAAVCTLTTNHRGWVSQWADELNENALPRTGLPTDPMIVTLPYEPHKPKSYFDWVTIGPQPDLVPTVTCSAEQE